MIQTVGLNLVIPQQRVSKQYIARSVINCNYNQPENYLQSKEHSES